MAERLKLLLPHGAPWVPTLLLLETASVALAGQPRIALEMFCSHLVQFDAEAPDWLRCELDAIAAELKMASPFASRTGT